MSQLSLLQEPTENDYKKRIQVLEKKIVELENELKRLRPQPINNPIDVSLGQQYRIREDARKLKIDLSNPLLQHILSYYTNYWYAKGMLIKFIKIKKYFEKHTLLHLVDAAKVISLSVAATRDTLSKLEHFGLIERYYPTVDVSIHCYTKNFDI